MQGGTSSRSSCSTHSAACPRFSSTCRSRWPPTSARSPRCPHVHKRHPALTPFSHGSGQRSHGDGTQPVQPQPPLDPAGAWRGFGGWQSYDRQLAEQWSCMSDITLLQVMHPVKGSIFSRVISGVQTFREFNSSCKQSTQSSFEPAVSLVQTIRALQTGIFCILPGAGVDGSAAVPRPGLHPGADSPVAGAALPVSRAVAAGGNLEGAVPGTCANPQARSVRTTPPAQHCAGLLTGA